MPEPKPRYDAESFVAGVQEGRNEMLKLFQDQIDAAMQSRPVQIVLSQPFGVADYQKLLNDLEKRFPTDEEIDVAAEARQSGESEQYAFKDGVSSLRERLNK